MKKIVLYGSPLSLYTGRARSYLIKAGLEYQETVPISSYYKETVLPRAGNRSGVPTIETAEGEVIRDGAAIIDYYENHHGHHFSPSTPKQRILSRLFDGALSSEAFGDEAYSDCDSESRERHQ